MLLYLKKFRFLNIGIFFLILIYNIVYVICAFVGMEVASAIIEGNLNRLVYMMLINSGLWCIFSIVEYFKNILQARTIANMNESMREQISENLMKKSHQEYAKKDVGEYISWYTNDIKESEIQGFRTFYDCVDYIAKFIVGCVALLLLRAELLLVTIVVTVLIIFISNKLDIKTEEKANIISEGMEIFTNKIREQLMGFPILKYFGYIKRFHNDMSDASNVIESKRYNFVKYKEKAELGISFINIIGQFTINIITFSMCALRILPVQVFFGSGNITSMTSNSIQELTKLRITLTSAKPYYKKIEIHKQSGTSNSKIDGNLKPLRDCIEIKNLSFSYGDKKVLHDINMKFSINGKYALVGESGCGKSTVLKLILGQLPNYQGDILFDNVNAKKYNIDSFYQQIAYIEQDVFLYNKTIRENIVLDGKFSESEIYDALEKSALAKDIKNFENGLDTIVGDNGSRLSGGQKQRIAVARALVHKRSILLVDEGTSALDEKNADIIEDTLLHCQELTLILVSHHLKEEKKSLFSNVYYL